MYVFHIADLHIHEAKASALREAVRQLVCLIRSVKIEPKYVVIAGDIFHFHNTYSAADLALFYDILNEIAPQVDAVIAMYGNHDSDLRYSAMPLPAPIRGCPVNFHLLNGDTPIEMASIAFHCVKPGLSKPAPLPTPISGKKNILVMHEDIATNMPKHGIVEHADGTIVDAPVSTYSLHGRVTVDELVAGQWTVVMAGHIHDFTVLPAGIPIAYCGALVQQTIGECVGKGVLCWDLTTAPASMVFTPLADETAALKYVEIQGDEPSFALNLIHKDIPLPTRPARVSMLARTTRGHTIVATKHSNVATTWVTERVAPSTGATTGEGDTDQPWNHDELALSLLSNNPHKDAIINQFKAISGHENHTATKWLPLRLKWSNMLCFGPDNEIVFDGENNAIYTLIAENRRGKSAVIEIMLYAIYGTRLSGRSIGNLPNRHSNGKISIYFEFAYSGVNYAIARMRDGHASMITKYTKSGATMEKREAEQLMKEIFGRMDLCLATSIATQSRHCDITSLTPLKTYEFFCALLGLDRYPVIEATADKASTALKRKIHGLETMHPDELRKQSADMQAELTSLGEITMRETPPPPRNRRPDAIQSEISSIQCGPSAMPASAADLAEAQMAVQSLRCAGKGHESLLNVAKANLDQYGTLAQEHVCLGAKLTDYTRILTDARNCAKYAPQTSLEESLSALEAAEARIKATVSQQNWIRAQQLKAKIAELAAAPQTRLCTTTLRTLIAELPRDPACECCKKAKRRMRTLLASSKTSSRPEVELALYERELAQIGEDMVETAAKTEELEASYHLDINAAKEAKSAISLHRKYAAALGGRSVDELKVAAEEAQKALDRYVELTNLLETMRYLRYKDACAHLKEVKNSIDAQRLVSLKVELEASTAAWNAWNGTVAEIAMHNADMAILAAKRGRIENAVSTIDGRIESAIKRLELEQEQMVVDGVSWLASRNGLPAKLIAQALSQIERSANAMLQHLAPDELSIKIAMTAAEKRSKTATAEATTRMEVLVHLASMSQPFAVDECSGYQQFVVALAMRTAFAQVAKCSIGSFLIIDEGFGCLDGINMRRVQSIIPELLDKYSFILVISHLDLGLVSREIIITREPLGRGMVSRINSIHVALASVVTPTPVATPSVAPSATASTTVATVMPKVSPAASTDRIKCECGAEIRPPYMKRHLASAVHARNIARRDGN